MAKALRTRRQFEPYVRLLADKLKLQDWTIKLSDEAPNQPDVYATVQRIAGRKHAIIRLAERTLFDTPVEQRHTITHELIHLHFSLIDAFTSVEGQNETALATASEYAIDGLADAIAPLLPLPGIRPR